MKHSRDPRTLELRRRAEAKVRVANHPAASELKEALRLEHELQVHQIELEMQLEELLQGSRRGGGCPRAIPRAL